MTRDEEEALLIQETKGRFAGLILWQALKDNMTLSSAILLLGRDHEEAWQAAWRDMHSAAHMWAAMIEFPELLSAGLAIAFMRGEIGLTNGNVTPFLRRSEELLDQMQARPDLAHPDPWRVSPEIRRALGLPPSKIKS